MRKQALTLALAVGLFPAFAQGDCKTFYETKRVARKVLYQCLGAWGVDRKPKEPIPADDCVSKLTAFQKSVRDAVACEGAGRLPAKRK